MRFSLFMVAILVGFPGVATAQVPSGVSTVIPTLEDSVLASAFDAIRSIGSPLPGALAPMCIRFTGWKPTEVPDLRRLPVAKGPLLGRGECPRTYASWVRVIDSAGRDITPTPPPGHVDPHEVEVWRPVPVTPDRMLVRMQVSRKLESRVIYCEVSVPNARSAQCGTILHLVH